MKRTKSEKKYREAFEEAFKSKSEMKTPSQQLAEECKQMKNVKCIHPLSGTPDIVHKIKQRLADCEKMIEKSRFQIDKTKIESRSFQNTFTVRYLEKMIDYWRSEADILKATGVVK